MRISIVSTSLFWMIGCVDNEPLLRHEARSFGARTIRVDTGDPPTAIAFRAEGSPTWQQPTALGPSTFSFQATGPYRVSVICDEIANSTVVVAQLARTPADSRDLELRCNTVPGRYAVTGAMVQAGEAYLETSADRSGTPGWQVALAADRGRHALIALGGDRIAVRRLSIHGDTALATPIDLATEGAPLVPVALTPTNLDGTETEFRAIVALEAAETLALLYADELAGARVAPSSVLAPRDDQTVTVTVHSPTVGRIVSRRFRAGDPTTFPLPEPLGPVAFDGFSVAWSTLPAFDTFELDFTQFSFETFTFLIHDLDLSRRFIEATGVTSARVETAGLPGFDPAWQLDPAQSYHRFAGVLDRRPNGDTVGSDVSEDVDPSAPVAAPTRAARPRPLRRLLGRE